MDLKTRLKLLRVEFGLTQEQVANKIDMSATGYGNIETGRSLPSLETLIKLSDLYKVSIDYIVLRSERRD